MVIVKNILDLFVRNITDAKSVESGPIRPTFTRMEKKISDTFVQKERPNANFDEGAHKA